MSGFRVARVDRRLAAALISLLIVSACTLAPTQSAPTKTLVVWVDTPAIGASIRQRIVPFRRDHPDIQIKVFDQVARIQNGDISIAIEALVNTELSPDVVALTDRDFRLMSNRTDLVNLNPYIIGGNEFQADDFFPAILDGFRDHGKQYAIPSEVVPWVLFYNKQLFDQAHLGYPGLKWTTSQFVTYGQLIQGQKVTNDREQAVGFVADPTQALLPFMETFGVTPTDGVDDPFAKWLADKRAIDAVQWFADLGLRQKIMPVDLGNRSQALWFVGRAGMSVLYMDQRNQLPAFLQREFGSTPTTTATATPPAGWRFNWGVTMLPRAEVQTTTYYVSGYAIPQASKYPDEGWLLIDYLTRNLPSQPGRAYVPSRESLAYSTAFSELYPESGHAAYIESVVTGHRLPALPPAANLNFDDVQGLLTGSVHPSTALQAYRDRIEPSLVQLAKPPAPTPVPSGNAGL